MRPFTLIVTVLTVVIISVVGYLIYESLKDDDEPGMVTASATAEAIAAETATAVAAAATATAQPMQPVEISIASSITKTEWLENAVASFNSESQQNAAMQLDSRPIQVTILKEVDDITGAERHWNSASIANETRDGNIQPTIISPANQTWVLKLIDDWAFANDGQQIATGQFQSLAITPITVAMWQSRAKVLGCWPEAGPGCTWSSIRHLAIAPDGWKSLGEELWEQFHLGYARVGASDVATQTVALICRSGLETQDVLQLSDINEFNECGKAMSDVETAITHRGTSSPILIRSMVKGGPSFLDAITTYEKNVLQENARNPRLDPLVAVFPSDGVVVADHVFALLDGAPWVSDDQKLAAEIFEEYLLSDSQQEKLEESFLRRPNTDLEIATVDAPDINVMAKITEVWQRVKKRSNIVLVFDRSGSMNTGASVTDSTPKLDQAISGALTFVDSMDRNDWLAWMPFNDDIFSGANGLKREIGEDLVTEIIATRAQGQTALYDAIAAAHAMLQQRREANGESERYGIVVLSDGDDSSSTNVLEDLGVLLTPDPETDPIGIEVHTIGIGDAANGDVLRRIAEFTIGGQYWEVEDGSVIEAVYERISRYF